nr:coiled-coil alpha-helical rod protein 1 [Ciona intestinalis]|eukprot:XP_009860526.2 coiled-coil alpha-helical rod protein 1 [Ciona intestinalis]
MVGSYNRDSNLNAQGDGYMDDLKELREENNQLRVELHAREPYTQEYSVKPSVDIISHQVKFIVRLQSDIATLTLQLKHKENEATDCGFENERLKMLLKQSEEKSNQQHIVTSRMQRENEEKSKTIFNLENKIKNLLQEQEKVVMRHQEDLRRQNKENEDHVKKLEKRLLEARQKMEQNFDDERKNMEEERVKILKECEDKCNELNADHDKTVTHLKCEIERLRSSFSDKELEHKERMEQCEDKQAEMRQNIEGMEKHVETLKMDCTEKQGLIDSLKSEMNERRNEITKMKNYIGKIQSEDLARSQWKEEEAKMRSQIEMVEQERNDLVKSLQVLNVRFESVSKILEMQEEAITAHCNAIPDAHSQNKAAVVTSQWRQKVFELMVRCQSQEIVNREELAKREIVTKTLNGKLRDIERENEILRNKITDLEARIELSNYTNKQLIKSNDKLKTKNDKLSDENKEKDTTLTTLSQNIGLLREKCVSVCENNYGKSLEGFLRLEQRLAFANNRIKTIQDLLTRRETKWRILLKKSQEKVEKNDENETVDRDLLSEVELLTEERNKMSRKLADDAANLEKLQFNFNERELNLKRKIKESDKRVLNYEDEIQNLNSQLREMGDRFDDLDEDKQSLIAQLRKVKNEKEKDMETLREDLENEHTEKLKENETRLNQVSRELTKTVVALRQLERSSVREKSRFSEQLELERSQWLKDEEKLRLEMKQLEKYNNLIVTTLRQEGLMDRVKSLRNQPITLQEEPKRVKFTRQPNIHSTENDSQTDPMIDPSPEPTNVDQMLQDLTNLSAKVLADDSD